MTMISGAGKFGNVTLNGPRVSMSVLHAQYAPALMRVFNDPQTMRTLPEMWRAGGWTLPSTQAWCEERRSQTLRGEKLLFTIYDKVRGDVVGFGGLQAVGPHCQEGEFGLLLHRSAWGTSIATETHLLGLKYVFSELGLKRVEFITAENNERMRGFFHSVGILFEGVSVDDCREDGTPYCVYAISHELWPEIEMKLSDRVVEKS